MGKKFFFKSRKGGLGGTLDTFSPGEPRRAKIYGPNLGYRRSSVSCVDCHHFGGSLMPRTFPFLTKRALRMVILLHI